MGHKRVWYAPTPTRGDEVADSINGEGSRCDAQAVDADGARKTTQVTGLVSWNPDTNRN